MGLEDFVDIYIYIPYMINFVHVSDSDCAQVCAGFVDLGYLQVQRKLGLYGSGSGEGPKAPKRNFPKPCEPYKPYKSFSGAIGTILLRSLSSSNTWGSKLHKPVHKQIHRNHRGSGHCRPVQWQGSTLMKKCTQLPSARA